MCFNFSRKSSLHLSIITRLIISINRKSPIAEAEEIAALAIEYYKKHPDVIVGIELSGDPMAGTFQSFVPALTQARNAGLKVSIWQQLLYYKLAGPANFVPHQRFCSHLVNLSWTFTNNARPNRSAVVEF